MYQKDKAKYTEAAEGLAEIIASGEFVLTPKFADIWVDEGEFNKESIFEANHIGEGKTWGNSWATGGTNLPAYVSPSTLSDPTNTYEDGWGFGRYVRKLIRCLPKAILVVTFLFAIIVATVQVATSATKWKSHPVVLMLSVFRIRVSG
jgi:hypothetical protein